VAKPLTDSCVAKKTLHHPGYDPLKALRPKNAVEISSTLMHKDYCYKKEIESETDKDVADVII